MEKHDELSKQMEADRQRLTAEHSSLTSTMTEQHKSELDRLRADHGNEKE